MPRSLQVGWDCFVLSQRCASTSLFLTLDHRTSVDQSPFIPSAPVFIVSSSFIALELFTSPAHTPLFLQTVRMPQDADSTVYTTSPYFRTSLPTPGVIHVEINRPDKLNAFIEE